MVLDGTSSFIFDLPVTVSVGQSGRYDDPLHILESVATGFSGIS